MANPNWKKGVSGNPKGRPLNPFIEELREAKTAVEEELKEKFAKRYVRRAFNKDSVMMDLAKKLYPDLIQSDNTNLLTVEDINEIKEAFINDINTRIESRAVASTETGANGSNVGEVPK